MKARISVKDYRGIADFSREFGQNALIVGENGAGKSSLADALRRAATGEKIASRWQSAFKRKGGGGDTLGVAVEIMPAGERKTTTSSFLLLDGCRNDGNTACPFKVGSKAATSVQPKEIVSFFAANGSKHIVDYLRPYCNGMANGNEVFEGIKSHLRDLGQWTKEASKAMEVWDDAADYFANDSKLQQAAWMRATGEKWGSVKAANWLPATYPHALAAYGDEQLEAELAKARDSAAAAAGRVEELNGRVAKANEFIADMRARWDALPAEATGEQAAADERLRKLREKADHEAGELADMRANVKAKTELNCPACKAPLWLDDETGFYKLSATKPFGKPFTDDDIEQQESIVKRARRAALEFGDACETAKSIRRAIREKEGEIADINARIAEVKGKGGGAGSELGDFNTLASAVAARKLARETEAIHERILFYEDMRKACGKEGFRQMAIAELVAEFNETAATMSRDLWQVRDFVVAFDASEGFTGNGVPAAFLSESERWLVDLLFQLYAAKHDDYPLIVIDRFDVLSESNIGEFKENNGFLDKLFAKYCGDDFVVVLASETGYMREIWNKDDHEQVLIYNGEARG